MGTFPLPAPDTSQIASINMISTFCSKSIVSIDPWVIPHSSNIESFGDAMPLYLVELSYSTIQTKDKYAKTISKLLLDEEPYNFSSPYWVTLEHFKDEFLDFIFPSDESIMEVMSLQDQPWEDHHHRSSFLPNKERIKTHIQTLVSTNAQDPSLLPSMSYSSPVEGNLGVVCKTISIDISVKTGITEHIQIGADCSLEEIECYTSHFKDFRNIFSWSYEEMPGIDP